MSDPDGYELDGNEPISPVIKDKHGNTVDGFHRLEKDPNWVSWTNEEIDTPLELAFARLAANLNRRTVHAEEVSQRLGEYYEEYRKEFGFYPSTESVSQRFGRSERWVFLYLPPRYKNPVSVEFGKKGGETSSIVPASLAAKTLPFTEKELEIFAKNNLKPKIQKATGKLLWDYGTSTYDDNLIKSVSVYKKAMAEAHGEPRPLKEIRKDIDETVAQLGREYSGASRRMSESMVRADTPSENRLQTLLAPLQGIAVDYNKGVKIDEDTTYFPDACIDQWLILEVEGEGSASRDNAKRDARLEALGKRIVHIPNRLIGDADFQEILERFVMIATERRKEMVTA